METKAAFIRTDRAVKLHAVATVDMYITVVVYPWNPELDHTLRLDKTLQQRRALPLRMLVDDQFKRLKNFSDCLQEFRLMRISLFNLGVYPLQIIIRKHKSLLVQNR